MKQSALVVALLMSSLVVSGCASTKWSVAPVRPDLTNPERFDCTAVDASARPRAPAEDVIDWDRIAAQTTRDQVLAVAREEVRGYIASVRAREGVVIRYVIQIEGQLFECANDDQWTREFFSRLPAPAAQ